MAQSLVPNLNGVGGDIPLLAGDPKTSSEDNVNIAKVTTTDPIPTTSAGNAAAADQVQGNAANNAADVGNPVKAGGRYNVVQPTLADGQRGDLQLTSNASLRIAITDNSAGAAVAFAPGDGLGNGSGHLLTLSHSSAFNGTTWDRLTKSNLTARLLSSAASTNANSIKSTAGDLKRIRGNNTVASKRYLKLYNKASAPTVGTDTPVLTEVLLASAAFDFNYADGAGGHYFSNGIAYAITGAAADGDTTAIAAGDIEALNFMYR